MYEINICHLYYDLLNLYGDRGNVITLKKRCEWRGIRTNIFNITIGDEFWPDEYDIVFIGGGQDFEQEVLQEDLIAHKRPAIIQSVDNGVIFLCICGGYQLMGKYYLTHYGNKIELLDAINIWTVGGTNRMIGNFVFQCDFLEGDTKVVGFENHSGKTYLGEGVKSLGKVLKGKGNNGEDGSEGAIYKNVYCSYSHGSLLPKNPSLADHLISLALSRKYAGQFKGLELLDDKIELLAHNAMLQKLAPRPKPRGIRL